MKRVLECASEDANALFHGAGGGGGGEAEERKALSLYRWEYSFLKKSIVKKSVAKEAIIASASSAKEAVALLANAKRTVAEEAPQIGKWFFVFFFLFCVCFHFFCLLPQKEDGGDDVLSSLPSADGSRVQSESDARLAQARARMAPIDPSSALVVRHAKIRAAEAPKPVWHAPWKLFRVISGHNGWVRSDVSLSFFFFFLKKNKSFVNF